MGALAIASLLIPVCVPQSLDKLARSMHGTRAGSGVRVPGTTSPTKGLLINPQLASVCRRREREEREENLTLLH